MFKIDFPALNKQAFSNELNQKVLREICCEARQRVWKTEPNHSFVVKGKTLLKHTQSLSSSSPVAGRKRKHDDSAKSIVGVPVSSSDSNNSISSNSNSNQSKSSTSVDTIGSITFDFSGTTVSSMINTPTATNNNLLFNLENLNSKSIDEMLKDNNLLIDDDATSDMP